MNVTISGRGYEFCDAVRDDELRRAAFDALARQTFSLSFEKWREDGWWSERYRPYALFDGEKAVANVSVNVMDFRLNGENRQWIQLGTVMTAPEYRGKGLSRWLMERALEEWESRCSLIYLFANDSVLDFYPRFGFCRSEEQEAELTTAIGPRPEVRKLDLDLEGDRAVLLSRYAASNPYSAFSMERNPGLLMFYCTQFMKDCVWYAEKADTVLLVQREGGLLRCWDVFGSGRLPLDVLLSAFTDEACRCVLGFTPRPETAGCRLLSRREEDETLFVRGRDAKLLERQPLMFPLLSHA